MNVWNKPGNFLFRQNYERLTTDESGFSEWQAKHQEAQPYHPDSLANKKWWMQRRSSQFTVFPNWGGYEPVDFDQIIFLLSIGATWRKGNKKKKKRVYGTSALLRVRFFVTFPFRLQFLESPGVRSEQRCSTIVRVLWGPA